MKIFYKISVKNRIFLRSIFNSKLLYIIFGSVIIGFAILNNFLNSVSPISPDDSELMINLKKIAEQFILSKVSFFAVIIGIITIVAFIIGIDQIKKIRNSIGDFQNLIERIYKLIKDTSPKDTVHILLYTPTTGCFGDNYENNGWLELSKYLRKDDIAKIKMICLTYDDIKSWYEKFPIYTESLPSNNNKLTEKEKIKSQKHFKTALNETKEILNKFQQSTENYLKAEKREKDGRESKHKDEINGGKYDQELHNNKLLKTMTWDQFRGYYIIFTAKRAIYTLPLFMPTNESGFIQEQLGKKTGMIGFESSEPGVVKTAFETFDFFWKYVANYPD